MRKTVGITNFLFSFLPFYLYILYIFKYRPVYHLLQITRRKFIFGEKLSPLIWVYV